MQSADQVRWPGWEVVRLIGRGSFGAVYEIRRQVFEDVESAALKVITIPESSAEIEDLRVEGHDDESITARFQGYLKDIVKEYSTMARMKGHPNVVYCDDVKYVQHDDGFGWDIYIKMELLTPIMKCLDQLESDEAVIDLGISICSALVQCWENGIIHRDIKPQNIFVSKGGVFKLGDFGIAKTVGRTTSGTKVGTYKYMAPEVYNNLPYGAAVDQYSLGLVMYWLLNERRAPFAPPKSTATEEEEARRRRFAGEPLPPPKHGSEQLQAIVLRACAFDPKQRYASAADMRDALKALKGGTAEASPVIPTAAAAGAASAQDPTAADAVGTSKAPSAKPADAPTSGGSKTEMQPDPTETARRKAVPSDPTDMTNDMKRKSTVQSPLPGAAAFVPAAATGAQGGADSASAESDVTENGSRHATAKNAAEAAAFTPTAASGQCSGAGAAPRGCAAPKNTAAGTMPKLVPASPLPPDGNRPEAGEKGRAASPSAEAQEQKKKKKPLWLLIPAAAVIALILLLSLGKLGRKAPSSGADQDPAQSQDQTLPAGQTTTPASSADPNAGQMPAPKQLDWSEWSKTLPPYVTEQDYEIEERTLYSSRKLETTSTTSKTMDGWELYNTASGNGDYGPWSDWSQTAVSSSDTREVDTQLRYHYRDKETTTSNAASLSGWELENISNSWGDYGSWSGWSASAAYNSDTRKVETKTQYQYRDKEYKYRVTDPNLSGWTPISAYTEYGSWGGNYTTTSKPAESDTLRITSQYVSAYNYYHYCCNWYNGDWKVDSCPYGDTSNTHEHWTTTTTELPPLSMGDRGGRQAYGGLGTGAPGCSSGFYAWFLGSKTITYVYQTRVATTYYDLERWGSWSSWSDNAYTKSSTRDVQTRTMYRYADRQQTTTYHYYRWGNWSSWSETAYAETSTRQVESTPFYRYRDRVKETTYYFRRWPDAWSEFSEIPVEETDTVQVKTTTEYRYKSR